MSSEGIVLVHESYRGVFVRFRERDGLFKEIHG